MKKPLGTSIVIAVALLAFTAETLAQQTPTRSKLRKPQSHKQAIQQQKGGQYPSFNRDTLPKGAINYNWATQCDPGDSTVNILYDPAKEIRVRTRQLIGTVLVFPEKVAPLTSGLANAISLKAAPATNAKRSRIWILGSSTAGLDGNVAFIGAVEIAGPRLYSFRVQTEGYNTNNCPDLVVRINSATDSSLDGIAARLAQSLTQGAKIGGVPGTVPLAEVETVPLDEDRESGREGDNTGRQTVDWLEGFKFDPTKLDFKWSIGGSEGGQAFAPDAVYSDDEFMYLKYSDERIKTVALPAISAVIPTNRGKVDAPVAWVRRGNTIIVQRITDLTLEFEGLVVCIVRDNGKKKGS